MSTKILTATKMTLTWIKALNCSKSGNPRFEVTFKDEHGVETTMKTKTDSADIGYYSKGQTFNICYHITGAGNFILDASYNDSPEMDKYLVGGFANTSYINTSIELQVSNDEMLYKLAKEGREAMHIIMSALQVETGIARSNIFGWLKTHNVSRRDLSHAIHYIAKQKTRKRVNPLKTLARW